MVTLNMKLIKNDNKVFFFHLNSLDMDPTSFSIFYFSFFSFNMNLYDLYVFQKVRLKHN